MSDEACERNKALLRAEKADISEEQERLEAEMAGIEESAAALDTLSNFKDRIVDRLASATQEDKRWVLDALDTRVTIGGGKIEIPLGVPDYVVDSETALCILSAQGLRKQSSYRFSFAASL